jgi:glutaredoxin
MKRQIEVFSAGCPLCDETVQMVKRISCRSCEITVHDLRQAEARSRAKALGVNSVPAVAINGELAGCCAGRGPDEATLRAAGIGTPL